MAEGNIQLMQSLAWGSFLVASLIRLRRSRPPWMRGLVAVLSIGAFVGAVVAGGRVWQDFIAGAVVTFSSAVAFLPESVVFDRST